MTHPVKVVLDPIWGTLCSSPLYKATPGAAAYDIRTSEPWVIYPGDTHKTATGFSLEMPDNMYMEIHSRSGLSARGLVVTQGVGIVDSDYRGQVFVLLTNRESTPFRLEAGHRIAQAIFKIKIETAIDFVNRSDYIMSPTDRGNGGFGSTGIN